MSDPTAFDGVRRLAANAVNIALRAGVVVTKGFADTVAGKPQPAVSGEAPLLAIVRHTSSGLSTLARVALDAARTGGPPPSSPQAVPPTGVQPPRNGPRVAPGETLHIPLSVDNPGDQPMVDLVPQVIGMTFDGANVAPPPVRFLPAKLTIAPRDFEKLVLAIDMPVDASSGVRELSFAIGDDAVPIEIAFRVQA